jgi:hypothetical protein
MKELFEAARKVPFCPLLILLALSFIILSLVGKVQCSGFTISLVGPLQQMASFSVGVILTIVAIWLTVRERRTDRQQYLHALHDLGAGARELLYFLDNRAEKTGWTSQLALEERFPTCKPHSALYYQLETLRLLGFVEKKEDPGDAKGYPRHLYRLTDTYIKAVESMEQT